MLNIIFKLLNKCEDGCFNKRINIGRVRVAIDATEYANKLLLGINIQII